MPVRVGALAGTSRPAVLVASVVLERLIGALAQAVLAVRVGRDARDAGSRGPRGPGRALGPGCAGRARVRGVPLHRSDGAVGRGAPRRRAAGWRQALRALAEQYAGYGASTGLLCAFFALTLLEGGFPIAIHYVAGRSLGLDPGWSFYIATVPLVYLVARLPVSLGGLGFLELSFVSLAGLLGVGWTDAFAITGLATALYLVALDARRRALPDPGPGRRSGPRPGSGCPDLAAERQADGRAQADSRQPDGRSPTCPAPCSTPGARRSSATPTSSSASAGGGRSCATSSSCCWPPGCRAPLGLVLRGWLYPWLLGACGRNVSFGTNVVLRHPGKIRIGDDVAIDDGCVLDAKGSGEPRHRHRLARVPRSAHPSSRARKATSCSRTASTFPTTARSSPRRRSGSGRRPCWRPTATWWAAATISTGADLPVVQQARPSRGIVVGPGGWLGAGAIVLDGVTVGPSAIVGAHAVVTQDVPGFAIVAGAPARVVRDRRQPA